MNDKLIVRSANCYREWMRKHSLEPIIEHKLTILNKIQCMQQRLEQIRKWSEIFLEGITPRIQIEIGNPSAIHTRIPCVEVYRDLVDEMVPNLKDGIIHNLNDTSSVLKAMVGEEACRPLSIREAVEELTIVNKEWDNVTYKKGVLSVPIGPVILDDKENTVDLGSFVLHLHLDDPLVGLSIEATNPVEGTEGYCHPHVRNEILCEGEGNDIMQSALRQGRLEDYFRIVEAIMRTYNKESPYAPLNDWYDPDREDQSLCDICGEWARNEYVSYCSGCSMVSCDCCGTTSECKACGDWYCSECMANCDGCGDGVCNGCNKKCCDCDETFCQDCIQECTECGNESCEECFVSCPQCGNDICHECREECCCCGDTYCDTCVQICEKCEEKVCDSCLTKCPSCNKEMCMNCVDNSCEHCGVSMCEPCKDEHNCLLAGISS